MLVVKIMAKNLDLALNFPMLMHCTSNKKLSVTQNDVTLGCYEEQN